MQNCKSVFSRRTINPGNVIQGSVIVTEPFFICVRAESKRGNDMFIAIYLALVILILATGIIEG